MGMVFTAQKRHAEAITELQTAVKLSHGNPVYKLGLGYGYALAGNRHAALQILSDLNQTSKQEYVSAYLVAEVHAGLGDKDAAFRWLEKAFAERNDLLVELKVEPAFAPYRSDPRFADLVRRIGLPE